VSVQPVQQMVDALIDRARAEHPGVEFSIFISPQESLLLPKDGDKLWRPDDQGRMGYYNGHVYRDCLVEPIGGDDVVALVALDLAAPTYYGLLITGEVTMTSPYQHDVDAGPLDHTEPGEDLSQ